MQMIGGNGGNQFRQYAGQNAGNLHGYNEVQNVRNQVAQNPRVQNNDNNVISEVTDVEQDGETVEQLSVNFEETRALYESLYQNLAVEVEKVNS
nr:hypothetical protein [Tanacetum cinerariifolium]